MNNFTVSQLLFEVHQKRADAGLQAGPFHQLVLLNGSQTLGDALQKLHAHKILGAPIRSASGKWAILDMMDVVCAVVNAHKMNLNVAELFRMKLEDCYPMVNLNELSIVALQGSVLEAASVLVSRNTHRVLVVNADDISAPVGLMSQMDIIRFVVKHWDLVDNSVRDQSIASIMKSNPVTVDSKVRVVDALALCGQHRYCGIGITNSAGKLIGNFSISDLRFVTAEQLPSALHLSCEEFLQRAKDMLVKELIICKTSTTVAEAAKLMLQHHVHRLYVQDESEKLVGLLSVTDLCALFVARK